MESSEEPVNFVDRNGAEREIPYQPSSYGHYSIYKVNNQMNTSIPSDNIYSHTFDVVFNRDTRTVERTFSFISPSGGPYEKGAWQDPMLTRNMDGGRAAILEHLNNQDKGTADELFRGGEGIPIAMELKFQARKENPEWYNLAKYNCKMAANSLFAEARPLILAFEREDDQSRQFRTSRTAEGSGARSPSNVEFNEARTPSYENGDSRKNYPRSSSFVGGGGGGPPGGGGSLSLQQPSPVGGVYLGGIGQSLAGLGQLKGIAVDQKTGKLVLLSQQVGEISLPPLRLDDLVTVFRSVYLHGEGPSVTINPDPADPHGPAMVIVHGIATPDTYVGWILFEADRIMKCYNLGKDNDSGAPYASAVPKYEDILRTIFFGGNSVDAKNTDGNWERFWIVAAQVNRFRAATSELTLFDVPLKVNTQKMTMKNGKLEDDPQGKSSAGATAFIEWFTRNYEGISNERYLQPPLETGITKPVPVFSELRRIALMTAIAEQLRDQGVSMPLWMRDYEVKRIPLSTKTKAMTEIRTNATPTGIVRASIYGGVNLSPADNVVKKFNRGSDLKSLPPAERAVVTKQVQLADALAPEIARVASTSSLFKPTPIQQQGQQFQAVILPGAESKALAPCRLAEVDLAAHVEGGMRITLTRHFNSFFQTPSPWGKAWTMDLPRLDEVKLPVERTDKSVRFKVAHELSSALGSVAARFSNTAFVPRANAKLFVPDKPCDLLALASAKDPLVKQGETELLFRDGRSWYFDKQGNLVAMQAKPFTTLYLRDRAGRVSQIVGYFGDKLSAAINLEYDAQGRLVSATTKNGGGKEGVSYDYDADGVLQSVTSSHGITRYSYERGLVKTISKSIKLKDGSFGSDTMTRQFEYASNGQLLSEIGTDKIKMSTKVEPQTSGFRVVTTADGKNGDSTVTVYDATMRPVERTAPDKTRARWNYSADGTIKTEITLPNGEYVRTTLSADQKRKTTERSGQPVVQEEFDDSGHVVAVKVNQQPMFQQQWRTDGLLKSVDYQTHSIIPQYDDHGRPTGTLRVKPTTGTKYTSWQRTEMDFSGRVKTMKDSSGSEMRIAYGPEGDIASFVTKRDGKSFGFNYLRNKSGQVEQFQSAFGSEDWPRNFFSVN